MCIRSRPCRFLVLLGVVLAAQPAVAVDMKGAHRTRGVGQYSCKTFVASKSADPKLYRSFGGWIDGFISAVNFYEERTFDIAPWQSTDILAEGLSTYCDKNPALPFQEAVKRLMEDLSEQRLFGASKLIVIEETTKEGQIRLPIYQATLERAQRILKRLGYYQGSTSEVFDMSTKKAFSAFQKRIGRPQTGIPDQITLLFLFDKGVDTYSN